MPATASRNWKKTSGRFGLPKFRQFVIAIGRAPAHATLRAASATAMRAARRADRGRRSGRCSPSSARSPCRCRACATTAASPPGPITVFVRTVRVVLLVHPALARDRRRREQPLAASSVGSRLLRTLGDGVHVALAQRARISSLSRASGWYDRAVGDEARARELGDDAIALGDAIHGLGDHLADDLRRRGPTSRGSRCTSSSWPLVRDDEHALLRLAEQDLVRRHPLLAHRHLRDVDRRRRRRRAPPSPPTTT